MKKRETVCVMDLGYIGLPTMVKEHNKKACMGLAFKPDIDDLREAPALYIARRLKEEDIIVFLVAHKEFQGIQIFGKTVLDFSGVMNV